MRITYKNKRLICLSLKAARKEIWRYIDLKNSINKFKFKRVESNFSFQTLQQDRNIYLYLRREDLYKSVGLIKELLQSKSKYLEKEELKSDLDWIEHYIKNKRYSSVSRWMSNIENTIYDVFNLYMEELKALPNFKKSNKNWI